MFDLWIVSEVLNKKDTLFGELNPQLVASAMAFRSSSDNYESVALPTLTNAYQRIRQATGASFDAEKAAKAELAWWVARRTQRRTQGQNSAEQVGRKIAELYAVLYGNDSPAFAVAGILRAQAAQLRDSGGPDADWRQVEDLLRRSYKELANGL